MAKEESKGYPMMPVKNWWALRRRFRSSIPTAVTPSYIAAALSVTELGARNNVLPTLRKTGLIDDQNKPTKLANEWRDDASYPKVCATIRSAVYPQEIRDLAPDKSANRAEIQSWFANHTASGESAAQKMAAFYYMLLEADASGEGASASSGTPKTRTAAPGRPAPKAAPPKPARPREERPPSGTPPAPGSPSLHLNIQIHLSPDATAEQIEKIFESMARHLKTS